MSRKQRTAIRVKGESGKPTANCAIYGYMKGPADKYHWLVDEETAAVVRHIFQLTIEGKDPYDIAHIIHDEKVEAPAVHQARQGRGAWKSKEDFPSPPINTQWNAWGHATDNMLKAVYQHTMQDKQKEIAEQLDRFFGAEK